MTIRVTIEINGQIYNGMETQRGTNRGIVFNPGRHEYTIEPNPHKDPWYNHDHQEEFYRQIAGGVQEQGNIGQWVVNRWPDRLGAITVNGTQYTLSVR